MTAFGVVAGIVLVPTGQANAAALPVATASSGPAALQTAVVLAGTFTSTPVPTITGTPRVGVRLSATSGTWAPAATLTYSWAAGGAVIAGATASTFTPTAAHRGKTITVTVRGTRSGYTAVAKTSATTAAVAYGTLVAVTPTIAGSAVVGQTLTALRGTWSPAPAYTYKWMVAGAAVATNSTYLVAAADAGKTITVSVTGTLAGYTSVTKTSPATAAVSKPLTATPVPVVTGAARVGSTLTATAGAWGPAPVTLGYQWKVANVGVTGATASTYIPVAADVGKTITVTVTGARSGYQSVSKASAATAAVAVGAFATAPAPSIRGTVTVGQTLTAVTGTWSPTATLGYQWKVGGTAVASATGPTYVLGPADASKTVTVTVTASRAGYASVSVTSAATGAVAAASFTASPVPTISGSVIVGQRLTAVAGTWSPAPDGFTYRWFIGGVVVGTDSSYVPVAADAGKQIFVSVTGTKAGFVTRSSSSAKTAAVLNVFQATPVPQLVGTPGVGSQLGSARGTWSPAAETYAYQWRVGGVPVAAPAGTANTYTPVAADQGKTVTLTITASRAGYATVSLTSATSAPVAAPTPNLTAPTPTVAGSLVVGATLTANAGIWAPAPVALAYQWKRNGAAITGATAPTFVLTAQDAGTSITVTVTGTKTGYLTAAKTSSAAKVAWAKPVSGTISANTIWGGTGIRTYLVSGDLTVAPGVTLTIAAGTIVKFDGGRLNVAGMLKVTGTSTSPVTFTALADDSVGGDWNDDGTDTAPSQGDWRGIGADDGNGFSEGSLVLTGLTSRYGSGVSADLVTDSQVVRITNSTISGTVTVSRSGDYEARLSELTLTGNLVRQGQLIVDNQNAEPEVVTTVRANSITGVTDSWFAAHISDVRFSPQNISSNTATGNAANVIALDGNLIADWTIDSTARYVIGSLSVEPGVTLTAPAGRVVKFSGGSIAVSGTFVANGTAALPVVFTSFSDDSVGGDWNGDGTSTTPDTYVWSGIHSEGVGSIIATGLNLRYGNGISADLYVDSQIFRVTNSSISGGLHATRDGQYEARLSELTVVGNTITGGPLSVSNNNAEPEVLTTVKSNSVTGYVNRSFPVLISDERLSTQAISGNTATGNTFDVVYLSGTLITDWVIDSTAKYILGSLTVTAGITLTAPAGRVVKFEGGQIIVAGSLVVNGTAASPVVFTSFADDTAGGDWNSDAAKTTPSAGDWSGIGADGVTGSLIVNGLSARYGGGVDAGLSADAQVFRVTNSSIAGGLSVSRSSDYEARLSEITVTGNTITGGRLVVANNNTEPVVKTIVKSNTVTGDLRREYAVVISDELLSLQNITGNTVSGNTFNVVYLQGALLADWTIDSTANYVFGQITVPAGVTLTAPASRIVKFDGAGMDVSGTLRVQGTTALPVVFTSFLDDSAGGDWNADAAKTVPSPYDWSGISNGDGVGSIFASSLSLRFGQGLSAGLSSAGQVLRVSNSTIVGGLRAWRSTDFDARLTELTLTGNSITGGALSVNNGNEDAATKTTVRSNSVTGNVSRADAVDITDVRFSAANISANTASSNTFNTVRLGGTLVTDWSIDAAAKYVFSDFTIAKGVTLTAPAGRIVKFLGTSLTVAGTFIANGTATSPVVFTSFYDDAAGGDWNVDGAKTTPSTGDWVGIAAAEGGTIAATGLTLKYAQVGLDVAGAAVSMRGTFVADGTAINSDGTYVDAQNIDWGSAAGPGLSAIAGSGVSYTPWVGYVAPPKPPQAAPQPVAAGNSTRCTAYTVFGLRGSKEDPQGDYSLQFGWSYPVFDGSTDGFGRFNQTVFDAFDSYQTGTKKQVAIQYSALPVPVVDLRVGPGIYNDSIFDGVDKLIARMNVEDTDCPNTKFIVIGYSQGALAAHVAFRVLKDSGPQMLAKVAGVAFISDPGRVHNPKEAWWASASLDDDQNLTVQAPGLAESVSSGVWSPVGILPGLAGGPLPDAVAAKTTELCHNRDLVCSTFLGAGIGPHEDYSESELAALGFMLASTAP